MTPLGNYVPPENNGKAAMSASTFLQKNWEVLYRLGRLPEPVPALTLVTGKPDSRLNQHSFFLNNAGQPFAVKSEIETDLLALNLVGVSPVGFLWGGLAALVRGFITSKGIIQVADLLGIEDAEAAGWPSDITGRLTLDFPKSLSDPTTDVFKRCLDALIVQGAFIRYFRSFGLTEEVDEKRVGGMLYVTKPNAAPYLQFGYKS